MAFAEAQIDKAIAKANPTTLKIEEVVEIIIQDAAEDAKNKKPEPVKPQTNEIIQWKEYFCDSCTYKNDENPGPNCSICDNPAPESAKIFKISEKQKTENLKKQKEEEETRKQAEREEKMRHEQERKVQLLKDSLTECQNYYQSTEAIAFFSALQNEGKSLQPVLFGCALQGKGWVDLHFKYARYRQSYIDKCFGGELNFLEQLTTSQTAVESIIPSTIL